MLLKLTNLEISEIPLEPRSIPKFLGNEDMIMGYFAIYLTKQLTKEQLAEYIVAKQDMLYTFIQENTVGEGIELTFYDEEAYNWWNNLKHTATCTFKEVYKYPNCWEIKVPKPPEHIFELD